METREFVIPIHDLDAAGKSYRFDLPMSWLVRALEGCEMQPAGSDAVAKVELSKTGTDVLVRGTIQVELVVPCARCLSTVLFRPAIELSLVLEPAASTPMLPPNVRRLHAPGGRRQAADARSDRPAAKGGDASRSVRAGAGKPDAKVEGPVGSGRSAASKSASAAQSTRTGAAKGQVKTWEEEDDVSELDVDRDTYEGEEVVLDRFFREALLLESPIFPLCSESCEGIRPAQASAPLREEDGGGSEPRISSRIAPADRRNSKE